MLLHIYHVTSNNSLPNIYVEIYEETCKIKPLLTGRRWMLWERRHSLILEKRGWKCPVPPPFLQLVMFSITSKKALAYIYLVWEETRGKQTHLALAQEDRSPLEARHFWGIETKIGQAGLYPIPFLMQLFLPDDEDSLQRQTAHLWWWFRTNQSYLPSHWTITRRDEHMSYRLSIGCRH